MRATQSQSRSLFIRISGGDIFQIFNSQDAENGAYPPTQNGLIHPQLLLKWP